MGSEIGRSGSSRVMRSVSRGDGIGGLYRTHTTVTTQIYCETSLYLPNLPIRTIRSQGWDPHVKELFIDVSVEAVRYEVT